MGESCQGKSTHRHTTVWDIDVDQFIEFNEFGEFYGFVGLVEFIELVGFEQISPFRDEAP